jgi:hypothetical protein
VTTVNAREHESKLPASESARHGSDSRQVPDIGLLSEPANFTPETYSFGQLLKLQSAAGNSAMASLMRQPARDARTPAGLSMSSTGTSLAVQRHNPTGADPEAALADLGAGAGLGGPAPATPVTATAAPAGGGAGPAAAAPLPAEKVDPAAAFKVLQGSFESVKKMTTTKIVALSLADVQAAYAKDCNDRGALHDDPAGKRPWTAADAKSVGGFYTDLTNTIYVNNDLPILGYVHELLHRNADPGFDGVAGRPINEGATDTFAVKACIAAGLSNYGPPGYVKEMDVVTGIIAIIGEATLIQAYFNSPGLLVSAFDASQGTGSYASLRLAMDNHEDWKIPSLIAPASVESKIARINDLFGGFFHWVSDADIESIIGIVNSAKSSAEKAQLQATVREKVTSLGDHGQRARLRAGCDLM